MFPFLFQFDKTGGFLSFSVQEATIWPLLSVGDATLPQFGLALGMGLVSYSLAAVSFPILRTWLQLGGTYFFTRVGMLSTALRFGGHLAALKFMDQYICEPETAVETLTILQTMAASDEHIQRLIVELGGIETTVKALKKHSEDYEEVAREGCGVLMNVCRVDNVGQAIVECGGITAIVQAMQFWPNDERVQSYACKAFDQLATLPNGSIRKKIIDTGGLVAIAEARTKHQNDISVRLPAEHALIALLCSERITNERHFVTRGGSLKCKNEQKGNLLQGTVA
jgi:hypothetical protein